ncbi:hypothetical protein QS713_07490 [Gleimia hominis]|uniref:Carrier domain-containing protein n=1 Tax=Gleimia hominis TaxID=595468 RepID=A0ABU3IF82_9ACTO|nr:phosphopantetheine-binding protein [Gleimia hominis]MDT3767900.1 hypothetical protein [Gleimia hominis]
MSGVSIAQMLGIDLPEEQGKLASLNGDKNTPRGEESGAKKSAQGSAQISDNPGGVDDHTLEVITGALLNESALPAESYTPNARLKEDFDLDTIGLYAVVAAVEDDLGRSVADSDVDSARTFAQLCALFS